MIRALYTSGYSMIEDNKKMDVISNNLANVDTNGFKKDVVINQSFEAMLTRRINDNNSRTNPSTRVGYMRLGRGVGDIFTNYKQGSIVQTGDIFNMAINNSPNSFFNVGIPDEDGNFTTRYTRDGFFTKDPEGRLMTNEGQFLLGYNEIQWGEPVPIVVETDEIRIGRNGEVFDDNELVGQLVITTFENTENLRKIGNNLINLDGETEELEFEGEIVHGSIEKSNVNSIDEMVNMITVLRSYEANQKMVQSHDNTLEKAVNEIGSIR